MVPNPEQTKIDVATFPRLFTQDVLEAFASEVHTTAKEHGWWSLDVEGRAILTDREEKLFLIVTELAEAFEFYRDPKCNICLMYAAEKRYEDGGRALYSSLEDKPEGFAVELADAYIRACDLMGAIGIPVSVETKFRRIATPESIGKWFMLFTDLSSGEQLNLFLASLEAFVTHMDATVAFDFRENLTNAFKASLMAKARYNKSRPYRHGDKRA